MRHLQRTQKHIGSTYIDTVPSDIFRRRHRVLCRRRHCSVCAVTQMEKPHGEVAKNVRSRADQKCAIY